MAGLHVRILQRNMSIWPVSRFHRDTLRSAQIEKQEACGVCSWGGVDVSAGEGGEEGGAGREGGRWRN